MASKALLMAIFIAAAVAPALAVDHIVEWELGFNYTGWSAENDCRVGDTVGMFYFLHSFFFVLINRSKKGVNRSFMRRPHGSASEHVAALPPAGS